MMASELNEKIDDLDDVMDAYDLMDELNISTTGLTSLEDAKTRLRVHVNKNLGGRKSQPVSHRICPVHHANVAPFHKEMCYILTCMSVFY